MAKTTDIGPLFFQWIRLNSKAPLLHTAPVQMTEDPYHSATALIVRPPFLRTGLVLGLWRKSGLDEEEALLNALSGKGLDLYDEDLADPEVRRTVRENIAKHSNSLDEEWTIINALGLT